MTLPKIPLQPKKISPPSQGLLDQLHRHARKLLEQENTQYTVQSGNATSVNQFYSTIMSSGTLSDKISALTISVQESPVHNMKALEGLVNLASKRSRSQAVEVLGALKDLFGQGALLPPDRKLSTFASQTGLQAILSSFKRDWTSSDGLPHPLKGTHLIVWAYEDWLKSLYFEVLKIIETWSNDEIVYARSKAVEYVHQLLREKPEQEANLLRLLINKLGDSDRKIASKTSYCILQLETTHPLMKPIIISSIESNLLFRPNQNLHAKYYAAITLNQTVLSSREEEVAKKLLNIYFSLFRELLTPTEQKAVIPATLLNKKGQKQGGGGQLGKMARRKQAMEEKNSQTDEELREKMLSAVLTGVNRAIPYVVPRNEL